MVAKPGRNGERIIVKMNKTSIEWCDSTWNPVTGCNNGCKYCYVRRIAQRFSYDGMTLDAPTKLQRVWIEDTKRNGGGCGNHVLRYPVDLLDDGRKVPYPFGFEPTLHRYKLVEPQQREKPQTIFVCSMADLFGAWVPNEWIEAVFEACEQAPQHRYLFLTKNPQRYGELAKAGKLPKRGNMWYGSTLDSMNARRYSGRFTDNTFVSIEPLTEKMDVGLGSFGRDRFVIIGAETGNRKGKVVPKKEWVDIICEAADLTHAAVFMKDSLLPIMGEANMRRELPWEDSNEHYD